ncbi:hypothetical protein Ate02nite_19960 [Paractinoplanes tereljensis]|uniref:Uncharacterized protein n=1 Tax=Paractinoplanes tereljensis TaxID=571912 RepID=A0A919TRC1_9ACTN|nr:hypothetical protein Ate02nite_19960 [Actinoplanes tereljensis]
MSTPIGGQLHLLRFLVGLVLPRDEQSGEGIGARIDVDGETALGQGFDDQISDGGEVRAALPVGEEVHVAAWAIAHAVGPHGITAGEGEPVVISCGLKSDLGKLPVTRIHAGILCGSRF